MNESWIYQGRQAHGWFGSGTSPPGIGGDDASGTESLFNPAKAADRVDYVVSGLVGYVPRRDRQRWAETLTEGLRRNLKTAAAAWLGGSALSRSDFQRMLLDPGADDTTTDRLREAAKGMIEGRSDADLTKAGVSLAAAAERIGLDHWPRFIADAGRRAETAVSAGRTPGVTNAGGTDMMTAGGLVGLAVLGAVIYGARQPSKPITRPPSVGLDQDNPANVVMTKPPRDAKDPMVRKRLGTWRGRGFQGPQTRGELAEGPKWKRLRLGGYRRKYLGPEWTRR